MVKNVIKKIASEDRTRRVIVFQRTDGTFGFEAQHWSNDEKEQCWLPAGKYSAARTESAESALREALQRVDWLSRQRTASDLHRLDSTNSRSAPKQIGGFSVVSFTLLDERHRPSGSTRHCVAGDAMSTPAALAICRESDSSFYLFYCDDRWEPVTDTWHASIVAAREQAELEFAGVDNTWEDV